jgi:hypothetical protein
MMAEVDSKDNLILMDSSYDLMETKITHEMIFLFYIIVCNKKQVEKEARD